MSNFAFTNYAMIEKYVLIFLLLGSQHAVAAQHLHYNVSATPNFVLGMYFNKTITDGGSTAPQNCCYQS